jgi:tRNA(Ile)-lysidine synthase
VSGRLPAEQSIRQQIATTLRRYDMLGDCAHVLVGLSGGQDSLTLLHALLHLSADLGIRVSAAHLHHGMRGEQADADLETLAALCRDWSVPFDWEQVSVPALAAEGRISLEEAGRAARYGFLRRLASRRPGTRIAVGHTAGDRAETVLMNILRGSGPAGLRGIPPVNGDVIRPLIELTREQTGEYCAAAGLEPLWDDTNQDADTYLRNRVRLRLIPLLQAEYAPGVQDALLRLAATVERELEWTDEIAGAHFDRLALTQGGAVHLQLEGLCGLPAGLRSRVLRLAVGKLRGSLAGLSMGHLCDLERLAVTGRTGAVLHLPFAVRAERGYNHLVLSYGPADAEICADWQARLAVPGAVELPGGGVLQATTSAPPPRLPRGEPCVAFLDAAKLGGRLLVRWWRDGDRVAPVGMTGSKKLQDVFTDKKVPRRERRKVPIVLDEDRGIAWVGGLCVARSVCVCATTRSCVRLCWERAEED